MPSTYDRKLALEILTQISDAIDKIKKRFAPINSAEEFTSSDEGLEKLDAICMQLIAVGESLKNLDKITSKNQITIPKKIIEKLPGVEYFEVELNDGVVMLKPLRVYDTSLARIRTKVKKLGLQENTVKEAIKWARAK
jgi:uncharacterized protein with HEPN domain